MGASKSLIGPKAKGDPRGGHVRLYWTLMDSPAWHALSATEIALWLAMRRQLNGYTNGDISATLTTMRHFGFASTATLAKSLRALLTVGLIAKTRDVGGLTHLGALCCLYRFTDEACNALPGKGVRAERATRDFERWGSVAQARSAIQHAHAEAKRPDHPNGKRRRGPSKLQHLNQSSSVFESGQFNSCTVLPLASSNSEPCQSLPETAATVASARSPAIRGADVAVSRQSSESEHLYMLPASGAVDASRRAPPERTRMGAMLRRSQPSQRSAAYSAARNGLVRD